MGTQHTTTKQGHLFTVEILIEEETNGLALETLVHLLNQKGIKDYRILNGMELGKLIELNTQKKQEEEEESAVVQQIQELIRNNSLIRLTVLKARGIKLNLPCRILNFDSSTRNISVYHVDEKKVYLFSLSEIEGMVVS